MGMIVTLYLISANVYSSVEAPKARGFSYIEVWMIGTQFPILLALFEYGLILYWKKMAKNAGDQAEVESKQKLDKKIKRLDFAMLKRGTESHSSVKAREDIKLKLVSSWSDSDLEET